MLTFLKLFFSHLALSNWSLIQEKALYSTNISERYTSYLVWTKYEWISNDRAPFYLLIWEKNRHEENINWWYFMSHRYNHYSHWCGLSILITLKLWLWLFIILHVGLVGTISEWVRPLYAVAETGQCHQDTR